MRSWRLDCEYVTGLYRQFVGELITVRTEQRELRLERPTMRAQLDDIEAEITYLLIRAHKPQTVVEIGSLHGWSTNWMLRALRDNGSGHLHTYDLVDNARHNVVDALAEGRWTFHRGDARVRLAGHRHEIDHLYIDAAHTRRFADWYLSSLLPGVAPGVPVSVHDVFHRRRPWPFSEGRAVLNWLAERDIDHFTPARAAAPQIHRELMDLRAGLGLTERVHTGRHNPMLFFVNR